MRDRPGERRWPSRGRLTASSPSAARAPPAGSAFGSRTPCGRVSWLLAWAIVTGPRACSDPAWGPAAGAPAGGGAALAARTPGVPGRRQTRTRPLTQNPGSACPSHQLEVAGPGGPPPGEMAGPRLAQAPLGCRLVSRPPGDHSVPWPVPPPVGVCAPGGAPRVGCAEPAPHPPADGRLPPQEAAAFNPTRHLSSQSSDWILP